MRNSQKKSLIISLAILLVVMIGIGYAFITSSLNINGTSGISKVTWDVHFENIKTTTGSVTPTTAPSINGGTTVNYVVSLPEPGSFYEFTVDVKNSGSIPAKIGYAPTLTGVTSEQDVYTNYSVKYSDGTDLTVNDVLGIGESKVIRVRIEYDKNITAEQLPTTTEALNLSFGVNYVQGEEEKSLGLASKVLFKDDTLGANGKVDTTDSEQTFITGTNPNNYIWYSGKLWRAVSMDTSDNSVKLVTQWNQTAITYSSGSTAFSGSHAEMWLNDTGSDGFLGTLYNYTNFIKTDSKWNNTLTTATTKPAKTTMVQDAVGLLNIYEYVMSYNGATTSTGYLNNGLYWQTLTPYDTSKLHEISNTGSVSSSSSSSYGEISRPAINLKANIKISGGDGTESNPYTLNGDSNKPSSGTLLNARKSGEYINFGNGNTYRIVSVEDIKTKIVSSEPLKVSGSFKKMAFDSNSTYNTMYAPTSTTNIGYFLNNDFLNPTNGYITSSEVAMLETNSTWYLGTVVYSANYSLGKCTTPGINCTKNAPSVTSTVGMLRIGEQLSGQFNRSNPTNYNWWYWTITPSSSSGVRNVNNHGYSTDINDPTSADGSFRPAMNLKSNIKITSGSGTKQDPFTVSS